MKDLKIGLIARADNSGLGTLSRQFYKHLKDYIAKVMIVWNGVYEYYPERFPEEISYVCKRGVPDLEEIDNFLKDINLVLTFETPYNWNLFSKAKERGIKTVLMPNYEWLPKDLPVKPDLFLCPSKLDYDEAPEPKVYLPVPIDREELPFKLRKKARVFLFNNGHGGYLNRNSLHEFLEAISLVKQPVQFIIHSQVYFDVVNDSRVEVILGDVPYEKLYERGDMFVFPHKFDGLSLPIQEAMSVGMPVISTDIYPHNTYLPKELLFEPEAITEYYIKRPIKAAIISPVKLAQKIEEFALQDISHLSKKMDELAEKWSWKNLKTKYLEVLQGLLQ